MIGLEQVFSRFLIHPTKLMVRKTIPIWREGVCALAAFSKTRKNPYGFDTQKIIPSGIFPFDYSRNWMFFKLCWPVLFFCKMSSCAFYIFFELLVFSDSFMNVYDIYFVHFETYSKFCNYFPLGLVPLGLCLKRPSLPEIKHGKKRERERPRLLIRRHRFRSYCLTLAGTWPWASGWVSKL